MICVTQTILGTRKSDDTIHVQPKLRTTLSVMKIHLREKLRRY